MKTETVSHKVPQRLYLSTIPYTLKKDRQSGEKDLELLVDLEKEEGAWLFKPSTETWCNLVGETFVEEDGMRLVTEIPVIEPGDRATHYHTHPQSVADDLYEKTMVHVRKSRKKSFDDAVAVVRNLHALGIALPSRADLVAYLMILSRNVEGDCDFGIASPYGMIKVEFDKRFSINARAVVDEYAKLCDYKNMYYLDLFIKNPQGVISDKIDQINKAMQGIFRLSMAYRGTQRK
ncbi:MAG TPA: hypothetical protein VJI15_00345 [Candidatus Nanoarchaeia archaeon]|nr:hypothetical protein [Candidatus Nanoarchaeia archaeon]